jgi:hypothetical protein
LSRERKITHKGKFKQVVSLDTVELQLKVLAVALHILPSKTLYVAVAQSCHAGKEEHLSSARHGPRLAVYW